MEPAVVVSCCCAGLRDIGVWIFRVAAMPLGDVGYKVYVFVVFAVVRLRVRYGADGAPDNAGPRPFSPPCPAQRPGAGCLFRHFLPLSPPRPPPHPYPGRVRAKNGW